MTDKTKKIVENSVFIGYLNSRLEGTHSKIFTYNYAHQLLYYNFKVQQPFFKAAREFENAYFECLHCEIGSNNYNKEWRDRQAMEMLRFNGKA